MLTVFYAGRSLVKEGGGVPGGGVGKRPNNLRERPLLCQHRIRRACRVRGVQSLAC